jgi:ABC-type transport system substrate-binding protein
MRPIYFFSLLLTMGLLAACASDDKTPSKEKLLGDWKLVSATRKGEPTTTLQDLTFNFSEDGKMTSNLFPLINADLSLPFELEANEIVSPGNDAVRFNVQSLDEKNLVLTTVLQKVEFSLSFEKM